MLSDPILGDCTVEPLTFAHEEAKQAFWHSSSHILGYAIEEVF
jgi:threonyl-tRNA synthetase